MNSQKAGWRQLGFDWLCSIRDRPCSFSDGHFGTPFFLQDASWPVSDATVVTDLGLSFLPRTVDKLGAVFGMMFVSWWTGWLAIRRWYRFASREITC